ncbi:glycine cleavage system H protein [Natronobacillus azotifigens]|uniref:Glycine cleavage system H protein n=1 Tax=Natronobacillus azotifigens TaxID=472978 RepID=A0A9J6RCJ9_9BACI|nr:glycine cleavage system protein GcvH [Natronobacillus azotifigens]MCZ0703271.1 glycine cleavage system protein GcvH [Natronobacillus azotifigens]
MTLPNDLQTSAEHVWVKIEGNRAKIGITSPAQDELGDIVFVELPEVGDKVEVDEPFGSVESVKTVSELSAPITGIVVEVNEQLDHSPELINQSPYDSGWMLVVEPSNPDQLDKLMTPEAYQAFLAAN